MDGFVITEKLLETVLKYGARHAEIGEFTRRAFLNGRIDLTQAEAIIDIIHGKTEKSVSLSGSIHTQVPVKPVCPNTEAGASGLQGLLSVCSVSGLSKPKPRRLSRDFNVVKSSQVARLRYLRSPQIPLSSHICAILATSCVVENKPAFPDTPPMKAAASSCTNPCNLPPRRKSVSTEGTICSVSTDCMQYASVP